MARHVHRTLDATEAPASLRPHLKAIDPTAGNVFTRKDKRALKCLISGELPISLKQSIMMQ
jgi:hypothetical protein